MHAPRLAILAGVVAADPAISPLRGVLAGLALGILLAREHAALTETLWADFLAAGPQGDALDAGARELLDSFLALRPETAVPRA